MTAKPALAEVAEIEFPDALETWRFGPADLDSIGSWLIDRLKTKYPHVNDRVILGWLRGVMQSNETMFVRSHSAVAMAQIAHKPLDPRPHVEEVFVLAKDGATVEAATLYRSMLTWATGMGAAEIHVGGFTDVEPRLIAKVVGQIRMRNVYVVKLPGPADIK